MSMASDESMAMVSSVQEDEYDDTDDGFDHHNQQQNLSRLSMCTSSMYTNDDVDDDDGMGMGMYMSRLSIESFDGDADEEFSDEKEEFKGLAELSSDSDKDNPGCYSLPATPPRRRRSRGNSINRQLVGVKDYASENEAHKGMLMRQRMRKDWRKRRIIKERFRGSEEENVFVNNNNNGIYGLSGESEGGGGGSCGSGVVVITRPKGGKRSLCMDMEEIRACKDLGFELENERMFPGRMSLSGSTTLDTSSGGNSPIANWRISSPGDDPRDVKARLKMWAQAVALASTGRPGC